MTEDRTAAGRASIAGPLLPPGLLWVYTIAPVGLAIVMAHGLWDMPLPGALRLIGSNYVPFVAIGGAFHGVYRYAMPPLLSALPGRRSRWAVHLAVVVAVAVLMGSIAHPLFELAMGEPVPLLSYLATSIVVSVCCVFPGLIVQRLRLRAVAAERAAMAERQAALQAQLDALQARTDPHFLFNSLNTVAALIPEDPRKAERTLERLADVFRYALESSRTRAVPLQRELEVISDYLALQSARFGERLRTRLEVDDGVAEIQVPPLLLQPLVENAILHGADRREGGEVRIRVRRDGDRLVIEVSDDGPGPGGSAHAGAGSAIAGITERIRLHYAGHGELALQPREEGGCLARMVLPIAGT